MSLLCLTVQCKSTVCRVQGMWSHRITNAYVRKPTHGLIVPNLMWMSGHFDTSLQLPILAVSYGISSVSLSCRVQEISMVTQNYQCVQNHETWFISRTHSSTCDGDVTILKHVFRNLNPCCIQWYKFRGCWGKGSTDTVTQIYPCAPKSKKWLISRAHSFTSDGDVTIRLHIYPYKLQSLLHPTVQVSCP